MTPRTGRNGRGGAPVRLTRTYWTGANPGKQGSMREALLYLQEQHHNYVLILGQRKNIKRIRASVFTTARRLGMRVTTKWSDQGGGMHVREL